MASFLQRAKNAAKNAARHVAPKTGAHAHAHAHAHAGANKPRPAARGAATSNGTKVFEFGSVGGYEAESYYRVDVAHGFAQPMNQALPGNQMAFLQYPLASAPLPPGADDYARTWWQPWSALLVGHIAIARDVENGDDAGAQRLLYRWEQGIKNAAAASRQLGDFNGVRTLVAASDGVREAFERVADQLREFMNARAIGRGTEDIVESAQASIVNMHVALNEPVAAFFAHPHSAAAPAPASATAGAATTATAGVAPSAATPTPAATTTAEGSKNGTAGIG